MKGKRQQGKKEKLHAKKDSSTKNTDDNKVERKVVERSEDEWRKILPKYPRDELDDRFMHAYDAADETGIREAIAKFGVIVINALSPAEADNGLASLVEELNTRSHAPIDVKDPNTWDDKNWPSSRFLTGDVVTCAGAFATRANRNVKRAFRTIYGTHKLLCSIDHFGVMRGTKNLKIRQKVEHSSTTEATEDEAKHEFDVLCDRPEWLQRALRAHWDVDPVQYTKELQRQLPRRYQGLIAMADCPEDTGGFCCVPGSAPFLKKWLDEGHVAQANKYLSETDPIHRFMQRFPLRKGQMVIWDYGTAHANFENTGPNMRLIQFVRYMPALDYAAQQDSRSPANILAKHPQALVIKRLIKSQFSLEDQKLFGVVPYE